jgi:hypothetical protein
MSAPSVENQTLIPATETAKPPATRKPQVTRTQAGWAGAAIGMGAGLLFAEMVVPAVILAAIGVAGLSLWRGGSKSP